MALVVSNGPKKLQILKGILDSTKFDDELHSVSFYFYSYVLIVNY